MAGVARQLPYGVDVARGGVSGAETVNVRGENPDSDIATPGDVWSGEGNYTFTAAGGAPYFISSSAGADTQDVLLTLLTEDASADWNVEEVTVTLAGQTKTAITTASGDDPVRILSAVNADTTALTGDVYVYEDCAVVAGVPGDATKVRAKIVIGDGQALSGIYTVPAGKKGFLMNVSVDRVNGTAGKPIASLKTREFGGMWLTRWRGQTDGNLAASHDYSGVPLYLPPKSDVIVTVDAMDVDNTAVSTNFDILLQS
jgi:hypothetical protein